MAHVSEFVDHDEKTFSGAFVEVNVFRFKSFVSPLQGFSLSQLMITQKFPKASRNVFTVNSTTNPSWVKNKSNWS